MQSRGLEGVVAQGIAQSETAIKGPKPAAVLAQTTRGAEGSLLGRFEGGAGAGLGEGGDELGHPRGDLDRAVILAVAEEEERRQVKDLEVGDQSRALPGVGDEGPVDGALRQALDRSEHRPAGAAEGARDHHEHVAAPLQALEDVVIVDGLWDDGGDGAGIADLGADAAWAGGRSGWAGAGRAGRGRAGPGRLRHGPI